MANIYWAFSESKKLNFRLGTDGGTHVLIQEEKKKWYLMNTSYMPSSVN